MSRDPKQRSGEILGELDSPLRASDLAEMAAYSEPQFFRLAKRKLGQTPMAARRRLLLERAAYRLARTDQPITEVAFDASFSSLEGFSRAFRKAYGLSASAYRKLQPDEYRIDLSERLHYSPPDASGVSSRRGETMKVPELMTEHHVWQVGQYLHACSNLDDAHLDAAMDCSDPFPWCDQQVTLREMLGRASAFSAPWMEAINGVKTSYNPGTVAEMKAALPVNRAGFFDILKAVEADNSYDLTFVDACCDPPHVFSYGWVIAHVLTHSTIRRADISRHLHRLGLEFEESMSGLKFE
jgi:AraC family transcriptional regulator